jgi:glycosyltransferase involved in cell wall biosynthesis
VITANHPNTLEHETVNGVHIHRVKSLDFDTPDFLTWVLQLNLGMITYALEQHRQTPFDVIHAHDWLVAQAGVALKKGLSVPLLGTIHATEVGRNKGLLPSEMSKYINQMEWFLCFESWRVIVCSHYMDREIKHAFQVPADKIDIIPNGIKLTKFDQNRMSAEDAKQFRRHLATDEQKLVFFVGRMVHEKGAQVLLEAVPQVLNQVPDARFVIVGKGGFLNDLKRRAHELGVSPYVNFTGFVSDEDLLRILQVIDVAVVPSLYEPFGIVALEGMASGKPTIVADAGGLPEVVEHTKSGITTYSGNKDSLAWGILEALKNPDYAKFLGGNARKRVEEVFNWNVIATATGKVYDRIVKENAPAAAGEVKETKAKAGKK